mgnify:CR=1 FL=1
MLLSLNFIIQWLKRILFNNAELSLKFKYYIAEEGGLQYAMVSVALEFIIQWFSFILFGQNLITLWRYEIFY